MVNINYQDNNNDKYKKRIFLPHKKDTFGKIVPSVDFKKQQLFDQCKFQLHVKLVRYEV